MKNTLSISSYVCTFIVRALTSTVVLLGAVAGLAIVLRNATGNNYRMSQENKNFEVVFFTVIVVAEAFAVISYLCLWKK